MSLCRRTLPLLGALALARPGSAQAAFPSRAPRILVPFTPGGSPDVVSRMLADESGRRWPYAMVVENRPGAGGNIAAEAVARATPDGHTLLLMTNNIVAVNPFVSRMPIDPLTDLVPVALLARSPLVLLVAPESPIRDLPALIAAARAEPGRLAYASAGIGSPHHLAMALLARRAGIEMTHVPYRGTAPGLADLVGGRVAAMASPVGTALPLIQDGRLRPLAAAGVQRLPWLPEVPTVAEAALPGYDANTWLALAAPRGTPQAALAALLELCEAVMVNPRNREILDRQGIVPDFAGPDVLRDLARSDHAIWGQVIREAGITAE
jgi:tripartite-type tricarboxylate transporter receptor subunit TctC